jgi:hypothetical protein
MQKIMFEHRRFGLEQAVIARLKENTRRRVRFPKGVNDKDVESAVMGIDQKGRVYFTFSVATHQGTEAVDVYPKYQIGEKVAVAQAYKNDEVLTYNAYNEDGTKRTDGAKRHKEMLVSEGYRNKLFVRADLMPHVIEITNIKAERLQDISDEDCMKEGVTKWLNCYIVTGITEPPGQNNVCFDTPREAFAALIDRLNGRGTWDKNEWQFAYTFELIK